MTVSTALPLMKMDLQYFSQEVAEETVEQVEAVEEAVTQVEAAVTEETVTEETEKEATDEPVVNAEDVVITQLAAELAAIKSELNAIKATTETVEETVEVEEVPEVKEVPPEIAAYEAVLETVIAEKAAAVPENIIALMPDNLGAVEKLAWIDKALLVVPKEEKVKEPEIVQSIGRPTPVPSTTDIPVEKMTASQKIASYFDKKFN